MTKTQQCDGRTDRRTDRRTDKVTYRVACTRLKKCNLTTAHFSFEDIFELDFQEHCFERGMKPYERDNYSPAPQLWNENNWCEKMEKVEITCYENQKTPFF